ncbi:MAG: hypothetical protein GC149_05680 [Gammaproteobacteria bacterium]|nr:hypothetical protein [Gammaproteobacteria bacterium]
MKTQTALSQLEAILHTMAKLYSSMFAMIVHERISTYHTPCDNAEDVGVALHSYIRHIKYLSVEEPLFAAEVLDSELVIGHANAAMAMFPGAAMPGNPLAEYFKKNTTYSELAPPIVEKLKSRAWEHTFSTIRYAHHGDFANAKLHADLANNAIYELSHFMTTTDYNDFKCAVKAALFDKPVNAALEPA